jgi:hypothetical protein
MHTWSDVPMQDVSRANPPKGLNLFKLAISLGAGYNNYLGEVRTGMLSDL